MPDNEDELATDVLYNLLNPPYQCHKTSADPNQ